MDAIGGEHAYGAAAPEVEERDDFYGSIVKDGPAAEPVRPVWQHGPLSRHDAEVILSSDLSPGNFLIRESTGRPGTFAISLVRLECLSMFSVF